MSVDDKDLGIWEQVLPEHEKQARSGVLESPEPVLGVAALYYLPHPLPATLANHRQEGFADHPRLLVVGEHLVVEGHYFPVLEMAVRVRRVSLEQLVAEEEPCPVQELGRRRSPAAMETRDNQLIAHKPRPLSRDDRVSTIQTHADGCSL